MPIRVSFRGPMLFMTDKPVAHGVGDVIDRVAIPDAANKGVHGDGTTAVPHTAGLFVRRPGQPDERIPLAGANVMIRAAGESGFPRIEEGFLSIPPLHKMTNPEGTPAAAAVRPNLSAHPFVCVVMAGGRMTAALTSDVYMELPQHLTTPMEMPISSMPIWQSDAKSGDITVALPSGGERKISLDESVTAFIYNWDDDSPTPEALTATTMITHAFQDDDFKWVYRLLTPPSNMTWKQWRATDKFLPAPRTVNYVAMTQAADAGQIAELPQKINGSTGTCDGAFWGGGI